MLPLGKRWRVRVFALPRRHRRISSCKQLPPPSMSGHRPRCVTSSIGPPAFRGRRAPISSWRPRLGRPARVARPGFLSGERGADEGVSCGDGSADQEQQGCTALAGQEVAVGTLKHPHLTAPALITAEHDCSAFSCRHEPLTEWLQRRSLSNQASGGSKTYVVCAGKAEVVGYYALAPGAVTPQVATALCAATCPVPSLSSCSAASLFMSGGQAWALGRAS